MRERELQLRVKKAIIHRYGKAVWFYHPMDRVQVGIPDIILSFYGRFIAIELKAHKDIHPSRLQAHNLQRIHETGGLTFWAYSVEGVLSMLEIFKQRYSLT